MNFPCPNHVVSCPFGDAEADLLGNFSAEPPDKPTWWGHAYPPTPRGGIYFCISDVSQDDADQCAQRTVIDNDPTIPPPYPTNAAQSCTHTCLDGTVITVTAAPSTFHGFSSTAADALALDFACRAAVTCPDLFSSAAQLCSITCPDTTVQSYTAGAGMFSGTSQEEADAAAAAFACTVATAMCGGVTPTIFFSSAQTCIVTCPNAHRIGVTVRAGILPGLTQEAADAAAQALACAVAAALCNNLPPLVTNTPQTCTIACGGSLLSYTVNAGTYSALDQATADAIANSFACAVVQGVCSGLLQPVVLTRQPASGNSPQSCTFPCPSGGTFTYVVPAGTFISDSPGAANAAAASYACNQAARPHCLSSILTQTCANHLYVAVISASGSGAVSLALSGTLPPGLSFVVNTISGIPTTPGSYSFTIIGTMQAGHTLTRTYTITVADITSTVLASGVIGTPYAQSLTQVGMGSPVWGLVSGTLPAGLSMNGAGVISGTPGPSAVSSTFTVSITEGTFTCAKSISLPIQSSYLWWKMEEATGNRIDSQNGVVMEPFVIDDATVTRAPGKVDFGVLLHSDATGITSALEAQPTPFMPLVASAGFTVCGWYRYQDIDLSGDAPITTLAEMHWTNYAVYFQLMYNYSNVGFNLRLQSADGVNGGTGLQPFTPVIGTWYFVRIWYDPALSTVNLQLNLGAVTSINGLVMPDDPAGGYLLIENECGFSPCDLEVDEISFWPRKLSDAEAAYLYNGGAGRTSPITFP